MSYTLNYSHAGRRAKFLIIFQHEYVLWLAFIPKICLSQKFVHHMKYYMMSSQNQSLLLTPHCITSCFDYHIGNDQLLHNHATTDPHSSIVSLHHYALSPTPHSIASALTITTVVTGVHAASAAIIPNLPTVSSLQVPFFHIHFFTLLICLYHFSNIRHIHELTYLCKV